MATAVLDWEETPANGFRDGAVAIGNFDGAHRGHTSLIEELRRQANAIGGPAVAVTFDPHPLQLLRPQQFMPVLSAVGDRAAWLHAAGADHVVVLKTTFDLLRLSAPGFFSQVVQNRLAARVLVEGPNFGFGRNREGTIGTLANLARHAGMKLVVVPRFILDGLPVSSSRVRSALTKGDVRDAAQLLGRPYRLRGVVEVGQRRGQTLGFPTANLGLPETLVPGDGVYAVRVHVPSSRPLEPPGSAPGEGGVYPGAVNLGPNPTFGEQSRKVEAHLIGFAGDLYGARIALDFVDRLRDTRTYGSASELAEQLHKDVKEARRLADSTP